ncbi:hypothetical protein HII17_18245 [Thalassotalea sp. M1531]|uniref:DUF4397 domain-containing protein n=1 Tax=Thalassotalea algicola TaxID=2716224 RepID=A0A7Y0LG19_9GAMM|nr:DUF4397 domain-containing protein [Thalassotalea algicola]NMP33492.1 hypothetical protein [Thalassotalea algicola]
MCIKVNKSAVYAGLASCLLLLSGCESSSSDEDTDIGYIQFYNASANAPDIYMTIDEDIELDSEDDDDEHVERTFTGVSYSETGGRIEILEGDYYVELGLQQEDSTARDDLSLIYQQPLEIFEDVISLYVLAEDVTTPRVLNYDIEIIDDDEDDENDLFNLRVLNLHTDIMDVDVYVSGTDETFNEATLVVSSTYTALTDNLKLEQDDYIFYLTASGSDEVLFESTEVSFSFSSQYVLMIRENLGVDTSPFVIDVLTNSSTFEYKNDGSLARFRAFNALNENELLANYNGAVDLYTDTASVQPSVTELNFGQFSEAITLEHGDYSFALNIASSDEQLLKNHLVTLSANDDKTIFFYSSEEYVDHDGDGDVDEDGDGQVDEIEITVNSLVVSNSSNQGIYQHDINIVNLIDDEDFSAVDVYFVRSDEFINTAENSATVPFSANDVISLLNNTYQVFIVASINSSEVILASDYLTLDEESEDLFLLLESDESSATGYKLTFAAQNVE